VSDVVRAAGGLVTRRTDDGTDEVLLVHRPRYDDWTFPKGKALAGESDEQCALREVEEETGLRCELEEELPSTRYRDLRGRRKVVRYWSMRPVGGQVEAPRSEVDEVAWVPVERAADRLSYDRDRSLLDALERVLV
jgi:8-oxo-dGTP pyrophosphatase MutT (NUDIX family)